MILQRVLQFTARAGCSLGIVVQFVTELRLSGRLPGRKKLQNQPVAIRRSSKLSFSVCKQAAKMLATLFVLFLFFCNPVCCVFQKLYCTISDSCDCDFKPNIRGETYLSMLTYGGCFVLAASFVPKQSANSLLMKPYFIVAVLTTCVSYKNYIR